MNPELIKTIIDKKVRGKIRSAHTEQGHFYEFYTAKGIFQKKVVSVTTKLILDKPHLIPWAVERAIEWLELDESRWVKLKGPERKQYILAAKFAHTEVRDDAGSIGSQGHKVLEDWQNEWIRTGIRPSDIKSFIPKEANYRVYGVARSGEAMYDKYDCIPLASELLVGMMLHKTAGTLDTIVWNKKEKYIELWDWKSSNQINQDAYPMQVAAYKEFFEYMTKLPIAVVRVIKLDKFSDKFKVYNLQNSHEAFKAFVHISRVYDWKMDGSIKLLEDKNRITL